MADQDYTLHYKADNTDMLAKNQQVVSSLQTVDTWLTTVKAKAGALFSSMSRSASTAAKNNQAVASSLNAVATAAGAAQTAANNLNAANAKVKVSTSGASNAMGSFAAQMVALRAASTIIHTIMEETEKVEEHWRKLAEDANKFRDALRELASMRGESGSSNNTMADVNALALSVGVVPEKARDLAQAYENYGPSVRDKGHYQPNNGQTKEQLEADVVAMTGRVARARGVDLKQAGELAGTMGLFHTTHNTEEAADKLGGALWGISLGSTNYNQAVPALNKAMSKLLDPKEAAAEGAAPGRIQSGDEAGVYLGVTTLRTGGRAEVAAHRMVQNSRLLNPDTSTDKGRAGAAALEAAGITKDMDDIQKIVTLGRFLKQEKQNPLEWLEKNKLGTVATREGMTATLKDSELLDQRVKEVRKGGFGKKEIERTNAFFATDRTADANRTAAVAGVIDKTQGVEGENFEVALKAAEARRRLRDSDYDTVGQNVMNRMFSPFSYLMGETSGNTYANENHHMYGAMPRLQSEAKRVGVDLDKYPNLSAREYRTRSKAFGEAAEEVKARGGDPFGLAENEAMAKRKNESIRNTDFSRNAVGGGNKALLDATKEQTNEIKGLRGDMRHMVGGGNPPPPRLPGLGVDAPNGGPGRK
ncbi:MAG: hypothetical protein P4L84_34995 [Isosphaeraceae bacterium]|nr:hypothetical protein [Isosphaeraceae bacterium]